MNILKVLCQYFLPILFLLCIECWFSSGISKYVGKKRPYLTKYCTLNGFNQNIWSNIFIIMIVICCWSPFSLSLALSLCFCFFLPYMLLITPLHDSRATHGTPQDSIYLYVPAVTQNHTCPWFDIMHIYLAQLLWLILEWEMTMVEYDVTLDKEPDLYNSMNS